MAGAVAQRGALVVNAGRRSRPLLARLGDAAALPAMTEIEEIPGAALAGHAHAAYRRSSGARQAMLPDFLIAAHAAVTGRPLLTRDPRRVATHIPGATLIAPH